MFNFSFLKPFLRPAGFLIITLLMMAICNIFYQRHGAAQFNAGYAAAKAEYKKKESEFISAASTKALESSFAARSFEEEITHKLSEVLKHEDERPLDTSCINDDWLQWYTSLVGQRK